MTKRSILIGSGFYTSKANHVDSLLFYSAWLKNTAAIVPFDRIFVVDNSEIGMPLPCRNILRIENNLGHVSDKQAKQSQFAGWSMSWIIPALIAYSENCDFVYKEQDCLAFGNWLPEIQRGRAAFGKHWQMECEQSLFWIERDFIPTFVQVYLSIPEADFQCVPERKFSLVETMLGPELVQRFDLGVGRDRPLPPDPHSKPWYAQKLTDSDLRWLRSEGLI